MVLPTFLKTENLAERRATMSFNSALGETYLEGMRISLHRGAGKSTITSYISTKVQQLLREGKEVVRIADFGSCEGDMLNQIKESFNNDSRLEFHGFDYNKNLIDKSCKKYPDIHFHQLDINESDFSKFEEKFDIAFTVNTLHEVFSFAEYKRGTYIKRKMDVLDALKNITSTIKHNGVFLIYDGVESYENPKAKIMIEVKDSATEILLNKFNREYIPIKPYVRHMHGRVYELDLTSFTRFITKLRFLDSVLWQIEKEESYQYFTKEQFIDELWEFGFTTNTVVLLRPRLQEWKNRIKILSNGVDYPFEHILIISTKSTDKVV